MSSHRSLVKLLGFGIVLALLSGCGGGQGLYSHDPGGVYHTVRPGQTLYTIARTYHVEVEELQRINGIPDPTALEVGQHLWIPEAFRVLTVPSTDSPGAEPEPGPSIRRPPPQYRRATAGSMLRWPVQGVLTSGFGVRGRGTHDGIDIGAPRGTPITAAADGVVKFSGWGPTGYGLMVIIKHPGHLTTVYAHNSKNLVQKGSRVKAGQKIGLVGKTGRASGPHLHFEVRNDTHPKDPLRYLSQR